MREEIVKNLSAHIEPSIVSDIIKTYEGLIAKQRIGDCESALTKGGRFVEHVIRAIVYLQTGKVVAEIKSVKGEIQKFENNINLRDELRFLIPRAAYGMIYNPRSKRNAVHVKEIDPRQIDTALVAGSASWIIAELLRIYHSSDEASVAQCMLALSRTSIPFIESIGGEAFVSEKTPPIFEVLLLLAHARPCGLSRKDLGLTAKCSPSSVTKALQALVSDRYVHQTKSKDYFITGTGEVYLADWLAKQGILR